MTKTEEKTLQEILTTAHSDYGRKLNVHAFFKLNDHELGEDLVQSTFMKTWMYLVRGGNIDIMKSFLYHILNALIIDEYRKHKATSLDALMQKGFEPKAGNPERLFDFLDGKASVLLIQRLPETYQKVMHMRYIQELSIKEMSLITGESKNAITVKTHRGLKKLRSIYKFTNKENN